MTRGALELYRVLPITGARVEGGYIEQEKRSFCQATKRTMIMLGIGVDQWRHSPHWSKLATLLAEWRQRVRSRHELERLSERDLADMGLTRLDVVNETQKPFWEA